MRALQLSSEYLADADAIFREESGDLGESLLGLMGAIGVGTWAANKVDKWTGRSISGGVAGATRTAWKLGKAAHKTGSDIFGDPDKNETFVGANAMKAYHQRQLAKLAPTNPIYAKHVKAMGMFDIMAKASRGLTIGDYGKDSAFARQAEEASKDAHAAHAAFDDHAEERMTSEEAFGIVNTVAHLKQMSGTHREFMIAHGHGNAKIQHAHAAELIDKMADMVRSGRPATTAQNRTMLVAHALAHQLSDKEYGGRDNTPRRLAKLRDATAVPDREHLASLESVKISPDAVHTSVDRRSADLPPLPVAKESGASHDNTRANTKAKEQGKKAKRMQDRADADAQPPPVATPVSPVVSGSSSSEDDTGTTHVSVAPAKASPPPPQTHDARSRPLFVGDDTTAHLPVQSMQGDDRPTGRIPHLHPLVIRGHSRSLQVAHDVMSGSGPSYWGSADLWDDPATPENDDRFRDIQVKTEPGYEARRGTTHHQGRVQAMDAPPVPRNIRRSAKVRTGR